MSPEKSIELEIDPAEEEEDVIVSHDDPDTEPPTHEGDLFEVSRDGLQRRSRFEAALLDVVEWQGRPLVAAGNSGVLEPGADTLELSPVGERFMAESFGRGASASVIVMADTGMVQTRDFVSYDVLPDFHFHEARDGDPPLW